MLFHMRVFLCVCECEYLNRNARMLCVVVLDRKHNERLKRKQNTDRTNIVVISSFKLSTQKE